MGKNIGESWVYVSIKKVFLSIVFFVTEKSSPSWKVSTGPTGKFKDKNWITMKKRKMKTGNKIL